MKKQIIYYLAIVLSIMLTGCEMLATVVHGERPTAVESIIIGSQNYYLTVGGEGILLTAVVLPTSAKEEVKWSYSESQDSEFVRIGSGGLVTGNKVGRAYVKATASNSKIAECVIHVEPNDIPLVNIIKDISDPRLPLNGTEILSVTLDPPNATNQILKWESENENVVTVLPNGLVTAKTAGTATIKVTATSGESTSFAVTVDASAVAATSVSISPSSVPNLSAGEMITLIPEVTPRNAIKNYSWSSTNPNVATVDQSGQVTGVSAGKANIIVTTGGRVAICAVTVTGSAPLQTPFASDYEITGLVQTYNGSPRTVSITPKTGKSPGAVTVYYNGGTTALSAVGTYTVTFDVAAATGWRSATGLVAGQLSIVEDITEVSFTGLTANGNSGETTSQLTLTFSPPITGLTASDITLSQLSGVTAGALSGSGGTYILQISGVTVEGDLRVTIDKHGYAINPSWRTVRINYAVPAIPVTFEYLGANGHSGETTTMLTMEFSTTISGLTASDITLSGVSGIIRGTLSGNNPYYLGISGFSSYGELTVTIGNKPGYAISGSPKTVQIFYYENIIYASNFGDHLATLAANSVSNPHNITVRVGSSSEFMIIGSALQGYSDKYVRLDFTGSTATSIEPSSLYGCNNLVGVIIPYGFISLGNYAFSACNNLSSVTLPNSLTSIDAGAFCFCSNLSSVTIPSSVTSIGVWAFKECSFSSVTIPSNVTSIGEGAFYDCVSLTSVTFSGTISFSGFSDMPTFPGNLRDVFYASDSLNGTPGTYTRPTGGEIWSNH